ncbi:hypothetical protein AgCh_033404 [Apium graveolens]
MNQYRHCQLPGDITPDFKVIDKGEVPLFIVLPFSILSVVDRNEMSRFPASQANALMVKEQQELSSYRIDGGSWDKQIMRKDILLYAVRKGSFFTGNSNMFDAR